MFIEKQNEKRINQTNMMTQNFKLNNKSQNGRKNNVSSKHASIKPTKSLTTKRFDDAMPCDRR